MILVMSEKIAAAAAGSLAGYFMLLHRSPSEAQSPSWAALSPLGHGSCALLLPTETYQFSHQHVVI